MVCYQAAPVVEVKGRSGPASDLRVDRTLGVGVGPSRKFIAGLTSGLTLLSDRVELRD